jgi:hypothetical protein
MRGGLVRREDTGAAARWQRRGIRRRQLTLPRVVHKVAFVRVGAIFLLSLLTISGCKNSTGANSRGADDAMFRAVSMRIHPIFTRVRDWTGDGVTDGIEALVEFQDRFGDPCKASGKLIFELYSFQKFDPERRGERICNPWEEPLTTLAQQSKHWNRISRTYSFQLEYYLISPQASYVLTAEFLQTGGERFFTQIILEPPQGAYVKTPASGPATTRAVAPIPGFGPTSLPASQPASAPTSGPANEPTTRPAAP